MYYRKGTPKECPHNDKHRIILKNYPFGKKSKYKTYNPPARCTEFCSNCRKKMFSWKPGSET